MHKIEGRTLETCYVCMHDQGCIARKNILVVVVVMEGGGGGGGGGQLANCVCVH